VSEKIAIVGLGYVGLPLAVAMARKHDVAAFDINSRRIDALKAGLDATNEVSPQDLKSSALYLTDDSNDLAGRDIVIVTVPTPIDSDNNPDFGAILFACELIGPHLKAGSIVVFESTVYPGATEEICGPALERSSSLRVGVDFKLGYSPSASTRATRSTRSRRS
jgi:UDP-N-acetyl-D-galactosamine dehydrogenase